MATRPDPFLQAHLDALTAVRTFLPSLAPKSAAPPPAPTRQPSEPERAMSLVGKTEKMAARVARGIPPEEPPPPTPEKMFGNSLDIVHTRAIAAAIAAHPETDRARLISEAHDSAVKWIASHNGKVIVHGKVELAHGAQQAEKLAQKIVNDTVEAHDQRTALRASQPGGSDRPASGGAMQPTPRPPADDGLQDSTRNDVSRTVPADNAAQAAASAIPQHPEIVPPGDAEEIPQGPAPTVQPEEAAKVGTEKPDGHQITQPKNSVAANQKLALEAAPELHAKLGELSAQVPGARYARLRPLKSADRLDEKVADDNGADTLSDYLGAQISADSPADKDALLELLKKNFPTIEVDDHFLDGRDDKAGYPSANAQVKMENGMSAEVQIVPREVQDRTDESHQFYKAGREAEEKGDNEERDQQWAKAKDIHQQALSQFKARNGLPLEASAKSSPVSPESADDKGAASGLAKSDPAESSQVAGYQVLGEPIRIGSHTFLRVNPAAQSKPDGAGTSPTPTAPTAPASPSADSTPQLTRGQTVQLKDGSQGKVLFVHPSLPVARVMVDGRSQQINPREDLA